jgi:geranylgeranyl diphosphate synthase, type II
MNSYSQLKEVVEKAIINLPYNTEANQLIEPVRYILSLGGKRLRPVFALMACNLFTENIDQAVMPATGLEIFHNFTLVHDDIMDGSALRRNSPTVHSRWNLNQAILSGDVMVFIANECLLQTPPLHLNKVFRIFNKAAIEVCAGQQLDIEFEKEITVSQQQYLRMIELKTAVLIAASLKIGAVIGGAGENDSEILYEFGRNLGLAFQIQDDLLDIYGDVKLFGKTIGGDIIANKKTFLLVKAFELASPAQLKQLHAMFDTTDEVPEVKVRRVVEMYDKLNIREITEELANKYIMTAFGLLEKAGVDEERKNELKLLAGSLIGRSS